MAYRVSLLFLLILLAGCGHGNTIEIGPGSEPVRINESGVFINSSLLGLTDKEIMVDTSANNELSVDVRQQSQPPLGTRKSSAF